MMSIQTIPKELQHHILGLLSVKDLLRFSETCGPRPFSLEEAGIELRGGLQGPRGAVLETPGTWNRRKDLEVTRS